jgi:DNA gyrase subunit B
MVSFGKLLDLVERKGIPRTLVELLLRGRVKDGEAFTDKPRLQDLIKPLRDGGADVVLERDDEHGVFEVVLTRQVDGQAREVRAGDTLVSSAEYRALYSAYEEFRELDAAPVVVVDGDERTMTRPQLVDYILAEGRRGLSIQRYKGLGEMNAEQLWESTMDPSTRTLLQVRLEDEEVAENMFTTLMGDAVEPRRQFIEENALNVRNLDI